MRYLLCCVVCLSAVVPVVCQKPDTSPRAVFFRGLKTRELIYKPAGTPKPPPAKPKGTTRPGIPDSTADPGIVIPAALTDPALRYNVLKVDPITTHATEVDPEANFATGDCFAVRFTPNWTGRLFVFNQGSSGRWQALLPSAEVPDEPVVQAGASVTVPRGYCFRIEEPRGEENLMVVVSPVAGPARPDAKGAEPVRVAEQMGERIDRGSLLASRDLRLEKIGPPAAAGEPPHSVYVTNPKFDNDGSLVIQIKIRHQ